MKRANPLVKRVALFAGGAVACVIFVWHGQSDNRSSTPHSRGAAGVLHADGGASELPVDKAAFMEKARKDMTLRRLARHIVAQSRFTEREREKINDAISRKLDLRNTLMEEISKLKKVVDDESASDENVAAAAERLLKTKQTLQAESSNIDSSLVAEISERARARLLVTGILDNGLGLLAGKVNVALMKQVGTEIGGRDATSDRVDVGTKLQATE